MHLEFLSGLGHLAYKRLTMSGNQEHHSSIPSLMDLSEYLATVIFHHFKLTTYSNCRNTRALI